MYCCKIEVLSHAFVVTEVSPRLMSHLSNFSREFITYSRERQGRTIVLKADKVYAWRSPDSTEYRFHVNLLDRFVRMCTNASNNPPLITKRDVYVGAKADVSLKGWTPYEEQIPIIEYCISEGSTKVIGLQTGKGKTSCSLKIAEIHNQRLMVAVLGRFYSKWTGDLKKQYRLKPGELICAKSGKQIIDLLDMVDTPEYKRVKVILVTINGLLNYANNYYAYPPDVRGGMVSPDRVYEYLGIGLRITDELHMHFYTNFMIDLFTHIPKAIYLSATLEGDTEMVNKMCMVAFPLDVRINGGKYTKIADCTVVHYRLNNIDKIKYTGFGGSYNHTKFEESVLNRKGTTLNYFLMIEELIKKHHLPRVNPKHKHKLLIFCATIEMCLQLRDWLAERMRQLSFYKYTSSDDVNGIYEHDVSITTIGSAGTALDIPGLLTCLMTTVINSRQANQQALGRLRDLRQPGTTPLFLYFCCDSIQKHIEYHDRKVQDVFKDKIFIYQNIYMEAV